jgi:arsenate reductase-like glutaredoxin family protein
MENLSSQELTDMLSEAYTKFMNDEITAKELNKISSNVGKEIIRRKKVMLSFAKRLKSKDISIEERAKLMLEFKSLP